MDKINKIMVAMASAEHSRGVYEYSVGLATALAAELIVVNVINERDVQAVSRVSSMGYEVDGEHYISGVRKGRQDSFSELIQQSGFPADRIKTIIRVGNPIEVLLNLVREEAVDMIVMGQKGRTNLEQVLVGSVAEKMFRKSPVTIVSCRG